VSFCAPIMSDGVVISGQVLSVSYGVSPIADFRDGRALAASSVPPPPIEWPTTARLDASTRVFTALDPVR